MSKIFTQLPEELFEHKLFKEIKNNDWRWGIAIILRRVAYADQSLLKKGQVQISIRQLAVEADITERQAEKLINHLRGLNTHGKIRGDVAAGLRPILGGQERGQKRGSEIPVYNVLLKGFYENEATEKVTAKVIPKVTRRGQEGDKLPRENATEAKKLEAIKEQPPQTPQKESGGGRKKPFVYEGPISKDAKDIHKDTIRKKMPVSQDLIQQWLDDYPIEIIHMHIEQTHKTIISGSVNVVSPSFWIAAKLKQHQKGQKMQSILETDYERNKKTAEWFLLNFERHLTKNQRMEVTKDFFDFSSPKAKIRIPFAEESFDEQFEIFREKFMIQYENNLKIKEG